MSEMTRVQEIYHRLLDNVKTVMLGSEEVFTLLFSAMLSGGHVLMEDMPGTGKTTLARATAQLVGAGFKRVQFTPDLLPQDITGLNIYSQKDEEFHLVKGPVFTNILLADEINRATPRTQAALLEAMEERSVTIDGETLSLPSPFFVIATENPLEIAGTFPLPEAQLDRFLLKLTMGRLSRDMEMGILARFIREEPLKQLGAVCTGEELEEAGRLIREVTVREAVMGYLTDVADATRHDPAIAVGVSPRGTLMLMRMAQAFAAVSGRDYVLPEDVQYLAPYVFAHRIRLSSGRLGLEEQRAAVAAAVKTVAVPVEDWK